MNALKGKISTGEGPVIFIAGGADVSRKGPSSQGIIAKVLEKLGVLGVIDGAAKLGEYAWNKGWKLDMTSNAQWMGELEKYLGESLGGNTEFVHMNWSGSASPLKEKEAVEVLRIQLREISKKHPGRQIICICKSLAGPYMMRALHQEGGITVTDFISLGAPWGRSDTIPDNIEHTTHITSRNDFFASIGNWLRFWNWGEKQPVYKNTEGNNPLNLLVSTPTHGDLNHDTPTGPIEVSGGDFPPALLGVETMYPLLGALIEGRIVNPESVIGKSHKSSPLVQE